MRRAPKAAAFANPALRALEKRLHERLGRRSVAVCSFSGKSFGDEMSDLSKRRNLLQGGVRGCCIWDRSCLRAHGDVDLQPSCCARGELGLGTSWAWAWAWHLLPLHALHGGCPCAKLFLWVCFYSLVSVLFRWQRDSPARGLRLVRRYRIREVLDAARIVTKIAK